MRTLASTSGSGPLRIVQQKVQLLPLERTTDDADLLTIRALVCETLLRWRDGQILPGLVTSWEIGDGGRSWLLHLRAGARFHDGSPCTSDTVATTLELVRGANDMFGMPGAYARYLQELTWQPLNSTDLLVRSPEPTGDLGDILAEIFVAKLGPDGQPTLGTGPYRVVGYQPNAVVHLAAAWPDAALPYPELTFRQVADADNRYQALLDQQADVATGLELLAARPASASITWQQANSTLSVTAFLNGSVAPFNEPEARLAVNLAVDAAEIVREVWSGLAVPAATVVSPYHTGYPPGLMRLNYDPEQARRLFAVHGVPDRLVLRTPEYMPDRAQSVAQLICHQLARVGLKVEIEVGHDRPQYAREVGAKQIGHLALFDSSPHSTYRVLQEKISSRRRGVWWQGVQDAAADRFIDEAHNVSAPGARATAYGQALTWLRDHPHWLYLYHPIRQYAYRSGLPGILVDHAGLLRPGLE